MSEAQFREQYARYLAHLNERAGFTEADFRRLFEAQLLRERLAEVIGARVPTVEDQVHARHILVKTEEEAKAALERIRAGEDFAKVAEEVSTDPGSKDKGGDLGWFPKGTMLPEFEKVAFETPVGQISEPVKTDYGYHIIKVEGHEERELPAYVLQSRRQEAFNKWLEEARAKANIVENWTPDMVPTETAPTS